MKDTISILERITKIETKLTHMEIQEVSRKVGDLNREAKLDKVLEELGRYKGFIGGVMFVFSAIWAFLKLGLPFILKALGKEV